MADVISSVSGGLAIGEGILQFLGYVRRLAGANVISALFDPDANRKEGDKNINVLRHDQEQEGVWWYEVEASGDYTFVRIPVVGSGVVELIGQVPGAKSPEARYWRWVSQALPGRIYGGESPSVRVDFVIVGYRPEALVKHFSQG